jgi:hypothetical protein
MRIFTGGGEMTRGSLSLQSGSSSHSGGSVSVVAGDSRGGLGRDSGGAVNIFSWRGCRECFDVTFHGQSQRRHGRIEWRRHSITTGASNFGSSGLIVLSAGLAEQEGGSVSISSSDASRASGGAVSLSSGASSVVWRPEAILCFLQLQVPFLEGLSVC